MKRLIMFVTVLAFVINAGPACKAQEKTYVGLFADSEHNLTSVIGNGGFIPFTVWIWWLPSVRGIEVCETALEFPSNVLRGTTMGNPYTNLCCCLTNAFQVCFYECQRDWVWSYQLTCFLTDGAPTAIRIVPTIDGDPKVTNCGFAVEPATVFTSLYLNQYGPIVTEPVSWGTIKSLYR